MIGKWAPLRYLLITTLCGSLVAGLSVASAVTSILILTPEWLVRLPDVIDGVHSYYVVPHLGAMAGLAILFSLRSVPIVFVGSCALVALARWHRQPRIISYFIVVLMLVCLVLLAGGGEGILPEASRLLEAMILFLSGLIVSVVWWYFGRAMLSREV